jgi:hypothetical protein
MKENICMDYDSMEDEENLWCNYSEMPSPTAYMKCDECKEYVSDCICDETPPLV